MASGISISQLKFVQKFDAMVIRTQSNKKKKHEKKHFLVMGIRILPTNQSEPTRNTQAKGCGILGHNLVGFIRLSLNMDKHGSFLRCITLRRVMIAAQDPNPSVFTVILQLLTILV